MGSTDILERVSSTYNQIAPSLIGIDDGYAQVKVYAGPGRQFVFPTLIKQGKSNLSDGSGQNEDAFSYKTDDVVFTIDGHEGEATSHDSFHTSVLNRVAVHHAIQQIGLAGREVEICAGLPFSDYFAADKTLNTQLIEAKKTNLSHPVHPQRAGSQMCRIVGTNVIAQGLAAFFDFVYDNELNEKEDPQAPTMVADIGGRTLDIAYVKKGKLVDHSLSESVNLGVLNVHQKIAQRIATKFGSRESAISQVARDKLTRMPMFMMHGQKHDVTEEVKQCIAEVEDQIARFIEQKLKSALDVERIIFAGGGAALFTRLQGQYPFAAKIDDPAFANARGMYKFLLSRQSQ